MAQCAILSLMTRPPNYTERPLEDEFRFEWGTPPPLERGPGRNPGMTAMIEDFVKKLKERPGEWAQVRWGVEKGAQAARPFERRHCLTHITRAPGDHKLFDVWAMWPFYTESDGTLVRLTSPYEPTGKPSRPARWVGPAKPPSPRPF